MINFAGFRSAVAQIYIVRFLKIWCAYVILMNIFVK